MSWRITWCSSQSDTARFVISFVSNAVSLQHVRTLIMLSVRACGAYPKVRCTRFLGIFLDAKLYKKVTSKEPEKRDLVYYTHCGQKIKGVLCEETGPSGVGKPVGCYIHQEDDAQRITKVHPIAHSAFSGRGSDAVSDTFSSLRDAARIQVATNDDGTVSLRSTGMCGDTIGCVDAEDYWDYDIPAATSKVAKSAASKPKPDGINPKPKPTGDKQTVQFVGSRLSYLFWFSRLIIHCSCWCDVRAV